MDEQGHPHRRTGRRPPALVVALTGLALLVAACGSDDEPSSTPTSTTRESPAEREAARDAGHRATVRGTATLDGAPFDADFLGVAVRRDGLTTSCQAALPPVDAGRFEVQVFATTEGEGCGGPGTEIALWTFAGDQQLWSTSTVPWPGDGETVTFDAAFATATPQGTATTTTDLVGEVRDGAGDRLEPGTTVEALVGETVCGVSTIRDFDDEAITFSLAVVGPDARPGCDRDLPITFRIDGETAAQTVPNDAAVHRNLLLTIEGGA